VKGLIIYYSKLPNKGICA